jgi:hypothetical protein
MFCTSCGKELPGGAGFCPSCGARVSIPLQEPPAQFAGQQPPPPPPGAASYDSRVLEIDAGRVFSFPFQDKSWMTKCLLLGLIYFIPVIGFIVLTGYIVDVAQRTARGSDNPLPEIDFGGHLSKGAPFFFYGLLLFLILLPLLSAPIMFAALFANNSNYHNTALPLLIALPFVFLPLFMIAFTIYLTAAVSMAVVENNPKLIFSFARCFAAVKADPAAVLISFLLYYVVNLVGQAGILLCFVGLIVSIPLSLIMLGHVFGQLGRKLLAAEKNRYWPAA